jgi:hypothetical protein
MRNEFDVLLDRVAYAALRADLRQQIARLEAKRSLGLVFESHLPERVLLPEHAVRRGVRVVRPDEDASPTFEVLAVKGAESGRFHSVGNPVAIGVDRRDQPARVRARHGIPVAR